MVLFRVNATICFVEKKFLLVILLWAIASFGNSQTPDAATAEFNIISEQLIQKNKFAEAIAQLEVLAEKYPTSTSIDSIRFNLGLAYLFQQNFVKAFAIFTKFSDPKVAVELREGGTFFAGLAKSYDSFGKAGAERKTETEAAIKIFSDFLTNKDFEKSLYREEAMFQRTKLNLLLEKFEEVQKGVDELQQAFPTSPNRSDYDLTLGQSYMLQTFRLVEEQKKSRDEVLPIAQKSFDALAKIKLTDSAVVFNEALFRSAELKNYLADSEEEFRLLIPAYRRVKPKNELIPIQKELIEGIIKEKQAAALAGNKILIKQLDLRMNKERDRLAQLTSLFDPAVQSMIQMAKIYVKMKQANEARVLLKRAKNFCKEEQKKEISYFIILTYAMQGLVEKADPSFVAYQKEFPNDPQADNISILIGEELFRQKNFEAAFTQYEKSAREYPNGRYVDLAVMKSAACKVQLKKTEEGVKILQAFVAKKKESPYLTEALTNLALAYADLKQTEEVIKVYQTILQTPAASANHPKIQYLLSEILRNSNRFDEAIAGWKTYREKYPSGDLAGAALLSIADATLKKGDLPGAIALFEQVTKEYSSKPDLASAALLAMAIQYQKEKKQPEMIARLERIIKEYAEHPKSNDAAGRLAKYYEQQRQFDLAEKSYQSIIVKKDPVSSAWAEFNLGAMYYKAGLGIGAYAALNEEEKGRWNQYMKKSEEAQLRVIKSFSQSEQVGFALQEILKLTITKTDAGLIKVEEAQAYFKDLAGQVSSNEQLQGRVLLAGAGIPFEKGNPTLALQAFEEIQSKFPKAIFSAEDLNRYALSLMAAKSYEKSFQAFKQLSEKYSADPHAVANSLYGMGASLTFQNKVEEGGKYFQELKVKASWSNKIVEADLGIGLAAELGGKADVALKSYKDVMMNPKSTGNLKARAMLGRGRIFELSGLLMPDPTKKDQPSASLEFDRVASLYGAEKQEASEALYRLGNIYLKNGKVEEGKAALKKCIEKYPGSEWATKAAGNL